jgi:hypothetical protein
MPSKKTEAEKTAEEKALREFHKRSRHVIFNELVLPEAAREAIPPHAVALALFDHVTTLLGAVLSSQRDHLTANDHKEMSLDMLRTMMDIMSDNMPFEIGAIDADSHTDLEAKLRAAAADLVARQNAKSSH